MKTTNTILLNKAGLCLLILILCISCKNATDTEQKKNYTVTNDTIITLSEKSTLKNNLKKFTAQEENFRLQLVSAGTVKAIPNFYTEIAPPYAGRVTKVYLKLGMKVNQGTPLFEMISPDFTEIQKNYFASKSELKKTELNLKRQKDLKKNGVGSLKDLEEAEAEYEIALNEYKNNSSGLKVFNVNPEKLILGQPLVITSPIKGEVIDNKIVNGHYIKEDDPAHAIVAQLDKVWVMGQVKEKDIRFVNELNDAEIQVAAYPDQKITGKIYHIEGIIDEATRSVGVLIECENKNLILKPGMYATVNFIDHPRKVLFVPSKSIFQMDEDNFLFVQIEPNVYVKRKVKTGVSENGRISIIEGLKVGETIISEGGFYLLEAK